MDAVTPKTKDEHSHIVRPAEMDWQKTRFPGCEAKTLLFDKATGVVTALMRFAPGAILPDHEHVKIEQTYVLEGRLVDKEGPAAGLDVGPGEFVWREPGSRHVAWCPEGGLMLAMFQIPNKFFERDGRVTDCQRPGLGERLGRGDRGVRLRAGRLPASTAPALPPPRAGEGGEGARHSVDMSMARTSCACGADARTTARGRGGMVDARDLKSLGAKALCRFESGRPHHCTG